MTRPRLLIGLAAVLCLLLTGVALAQTTTKDSSGGLSDVVSKTGEFLSETLAETPAEQEKTLEYWTPRRMEEATPRTLLPALLPPAEPETRASQKSPEWTGKGVISSTVGKVFFTLGGSDYVCSATSITSHDRDTLVTAGHCVHEGPGKFANNWIFIPGYKNGSEPYGRWTARALHAPQAWTSKGDLNYDFAFVELNPNASRHINDAVGTQSIAFNAPRGKDVNSFGFPAVKPYDGETLHVCTDTPKQNTRGGTGQGISCDMTEGSSGGPWLYDFNASSGVGTVVSLNSFAYDNEPETMWGPYLGDTARSLYEAVQK